LKIEARQKKFDKKMACQKEKKQANQRQKKTARQKNDTI